MTERRAGNDFLQRVFETRKDNPAVLRLMVRRSIWMIDKAASGLNRFGEPMRKSEQDALIAEGIDALHVWLEYAAHAQIPIAADLVLQAEDRVTTFGPRVEELKQLQKRTITKI